MTSGLTHEHPRQPGHQRSDPYLSLHHPRTSHQRLGHTCPHLPLLLLRLSRNHNTRRQVQWRHMCHTSLTTLLRRIPRGSITSSRLWDLLGPRPRSHPSYRRHPHTNESCGVFFCVFSIFSTNDGKVCNVWTMFDAYLMIVSLVLCLADPPTLLLCLLYLFFAYVSYFPCLQKHITFCCSVDFQTLSHVKFICSFGMAGLKVKHQDGRRTQTFRMPRLADTTSLTVVHPCELLYVCAGL